LLTGSIEFTDALLNFFILFSLLSSPAPVELKNSWAAVAYLLSASALFFAFTVAAYGIETRYSFDWMVIPFFFNCCL
jgi:hypothetical protein